MKPKPEIKTEAPTQTSQYQFDVNNPVDKFISEAKATKADRLPRTRRNQRRITGRGRMATPGFTRTSLDLPDDLYERVKIASVKERRTLREIVEEALLEWFQKKHS